MNLTSNAVEAKACGVARFFAFVYVDYSEHGSNNFGLLDRNGTPTRSMVAYATALRLLANKSYIGDLRTGDPKVLRARVFSSGKGEAVVVLHTGTIQADATVQLTLDPAQVLGADGRPLKSSAGVPVPDGMGYVLTTLDAVHKRLVTDSTTCRLAKLNQPASSSPQPVVPIIIKPQLKNSPVTPETRGYRIKEGSSKFPIPILVANLDDKEHDVRLRFYKSATDTSKSSCIATVSGKVPAKSEVVMTADVDFSAFSAKGNVNVVRVVPRSKGVGSISPAVMNFIAEWGLDEYSKHYAYRYALPLGEEHRWSDNVSATGKIRFEHDPEAQWGFTADFTGGDRWAYPKFAIPQEADMARVQGILLRARCARPATVRVISWNEEAKQSITYFPLLPADNQWHVAYIPLDNFVLLPPGAEGPLGRQMKKVSIGFNSLENQNHLEISDLYFLGN